MGYPQAAADDCRCISQALGGDPAVSVSDRGASLKRLLDKQNLTFDVGIAMPMMREPVAKTLLTFMDARSKSAAPM